ncbi:MAG: hypothetical protein KGN16_25690, partial [Burkholderiales bacterium]|nr:hypothetical protein [Burkholderiales bacterium]
AADANLVAASARCGDAPPREAPALAGPWRCAADWQLKVSNTWRRTQATLHKGMDEPSVIEALADAGIPFDTLSPSEIRVGALRLQFSGGDLQTFIGD